MTKQSFATALMTMVGAAVFAVSLPAAPVHAEEQGALTKAWDSTRQGTEKAWDKTKSGTTEAWDKTKAGTEKAWDKTAAGADKTWDKTKSGSAKVWDKTKSGTTEAWDKTKTGTTDAAHDVGKWGERTGQKIGNTSTAIGHDIHNGFSDDKK
ncbi:endoglucanase [Acetobacter okinawensis]|uniref:endoglucanase n=1 Tax=Acetobacter okinawensis TaxID=1076594 RepID=UPI00209ECD3E|nr:endoglucanase [Acetobacter okinawensis]MCP1214131.1 endoglucanase [Acetobacter okinawensis]